MNLTKKDKAALHEIVQKGLLNEISGGLQSADAIIHEWKTNTSDPHDTYRRLYRMIREFDKNIAARYDYMRPSDYISLVAGQLAEKLIKEEDLNALSVTVKETIMHLYKFRLDMLKPEVPVKKVLQFKITLQGSNPAIWRRFITDDNLSFHDLHLIIQNVMGWTNSHLYQFVQGKNKLISDPTLVDYAKVTDAKKLMLPAIFNTPGTKISYEYDFGDGWSHDLILELIREENPDLKTPCCEEGEMNCPPEDCGGIYGYYDMMEILKNKRHPEYKETVEWLGKDYAMNEFDINSVNEALKNYRAIEIELS